MKADALSWLRSVIEGDLATAKAAEAVAPGPWVNTGQDGCGDAWQIHGGPSDEMEPDWDAPGIPLKPVPIRVATLKYDDGGGVWEREAADHMVLQQPRDTIARCEAELEIIAECVEEPGRETLAERTIERLAKGYRHRPGFNPEWVSD